MSVVGLVPARDVAQAFKPAWQGSGALPYGNLALPHRICTGSFNSSNQAAFVELDGDLVDAEPIAWGEGMSVSESR